MLSCTTRLDRARVRNEPPGRISIPYSHHTLEARQTFPSRIRFSNHYHILPVDLGTSTQQPESAVQADSIPTTRFHEFHCPPPILEVACRYPLFDSSSSAAASLSQPARLHPRRARPNAHIVPTSSKRIRSHGVLARIRPQPSNRDIPPQIPSRPPEHQTEGARPRAVAAHDHGRVYEHKQRGGGVEEAEPEDRQGSRGGLQTTAERMQDPPARYVQKCGLANAQSDTETSVSHANALFPQAPARAASRPLSSR